MTTIHDVVNYHITEAKRCRDHIDRNGEWCPRFAYEEIATFHDEAAATIHAHLAKGAQEWQPIETAPKFQDPIDIWGRDGRIPECVYGKATYAQGMGWIHQSGYDSNGPVYDLVVDPTHWMPLPAAPMLSQCGEVKS